MTDTKAEPKHTWVWVLIIVLFALLVTGGVALFVLLRPIAVTGVSLTPPQVESTQNATLDNALPSQ
ncbi:MAG: hypothetical protein U0517_03750 [Candidatus Andersenbacteria bacterium]